MTRRLPWSMTLLATLAPVACGTQMEVGDKPINVEPTTGDDSGGETTAAAEDGPGMEETGGEPGDVSPPCELAGPSAGADPDLQWGTVCGGTGTEYIRFMAMDAAGATYVLTQVEDYGGNSVLFGDDVVTPGETTPALALTKLAPTGEVTWSRSFVGTDAWWSASSIAVCGDRLYFTANRSSLEDVGIDFGTGALHGNLALVATDLDGETLWAQATGQNDANSGGYPTGKVVCHATGGIAFYGNSATAAEIGGIEIDGTPESSSFAVAVVADADGNGTWGTMEDVISADAAMTPDGDLVTLGYQLDPGFTGNSTAALRRYDDAGDLLWEQTFPGTGPMYLHDVHVADDGSITVVGAFSVDIDLGDGVIAGSDPLVVDDPSDPFGGGDSQMYDAFVARYDGDGEPIWAEVLGGVGWNSASTASVRADGDVDVIVGDPTGTLTLQRVGAGGTSPGPALPGTWPELATGHPSAGVAVGFRTVEGFTAFDPALTSRSQLDFVVVSFMP